MEGIDPRGTTDDIELGLDGTVRRNGSGPGGADTHWSRLQHGAPNRFGVDLRAGRWTVPIPPHPSGESTADQAVERRQCFHRDELVLLLASSTPALSASANIVAVVLLP